MAVNIKVDSRSDSLAKAFYRIVPIFIITLLATLILIALWDGEKIKKTIEGMSWFHIHETTLETSWPISAENIKAWLSPVEGKSIFFVDSSQIAVTLEAKPWVKSVVIKKQYPDRLLIHVEPKKAVATLLKSGKLSFLDPDGQIIEEFRGELMRDASLPVVLRMTEKNDDGWSMPFAIAVIDTFHRQMAPRYTISQMVLKDFPVFSIFLSRPRIEVEFDATHWEQQLPNLSTILFGPPGQVGQINKISLLFHKKAVVRSSLSN